MKKANLLILTLSATALSACGYMKSLFPDKEKDYQYTTEIPALVIPPDLGRQDILKAPAVPTSSDNSATADATSAPAHNPALTTAPVANNQPVEASVTTTAIPDKPAIIDSPADNPDTSNAAAKAPTTTHDTIPVELIRSSDGSGKLRLGVPFEKAWRTVDKALSRKSIEVTARNKQESTFNLHYDPNEKKLEDGSLWNEALFIFSGFQGDEHEFLVKLISNNQQTDVVVLNAAQEPSTDAGALNLLDLLQETIKTDFAK